MDEANHVELGYQSLSDASQASQPTFVGRCGNLGLGGWQRTSLRQVDGKRPAVLDPTNAGNLPGDFQLVCGGRPFAQRDRRNA